MLRWNTCVYKSTDLALHGVLWIMIKLNTSAEINAWFIVMSPLSTHFVFQDTSKNVLTIVYIIELFQLLPIEWKKTGTN